MNYRKTRMSLRVALKGPRNKIDCIFAKAIIFLSSDILCNPLWKVIDVVTDLLFLQADLVSIHLYLKEHVLLMPPEIK